MLIILIINFKNELIYFLEYDDDLYEQQYDEIEKDCYCKIGNEQNENYWTCPYIKQFFLNFLFSNKISQVSSI
jgi:hypothetical protein